MKLRRKVIRTLRRLARYVATVIVCTSCRQSPIADNSFPSTFPYTSPTYTTSRQQDDYTTDSNPQQSSPASPGAFHPVPQHLTPMTSPKKAAETWDDDFEIQSNHSSRSSKTKKQKLAPANGPPPRPSEEESWDDAYEDEDVVRLASELGPQTKPDTDEEMASWGSDSEWSGDGDAEDLSHDSYTGATPEHPNRRSSSSASQASHPNAQLTNSQVPPPSNATSTTTDKPSTSTSFFSKLSPVKKWKARDADVTPRASSKEFTKDKTGLEKPRRQAQKPAPAVVQKQSPEIHVDATGSQPKKNSELKGVVPGANSSTRPYGKFSFSPSSHPASSLTPDLSSSPASAKSTLKAHSPLLSAADPTSTAKADIPSALLHVSRPKRHARPSTAIPSLSLAPSLPLLSTSAHNLPLSMSPTETSVLTLTPRRSSLSDLKRPLLKIPERISRVQRGIKRDMGDVREFADCVAQLKDFQHVYAVLLRDLRAALTDPEPPTPSSVSHFVSTSLTTNPPKLTSPPRRPSFSPKKRRDTLATASPQSSPTKPVKRKFSLAATPPKTPSRYATALDRLDAKYSVWWECAELLIELGGRNENGEAYADAAERSDEDASLGLGLAAGMTRGRRPRAVTLGSDKSSRHTRPRSTSTGPPLASPVKPAQRRATTGRAEGRDLTPRQLALLRGMLETDAGLGWDPRTASVERMREEVGDDGSVREKGKSGGRGIRDLWRGLRKGTSATGGGIRGGTAGEPMSRGSSSCDSSTSETSPASCKPGSIGGKTSKLPASLKKTVTAADAVVLSRRKQPTRRPSLAGIFGLGQKVMKTDEADANAVLDASSSDWDRMDVDDQVLNTVRGTKGLRSGSIVGASIPSPSLRLRLCDPPSPDKPTTPVSSSPRLIFSFSDSPRSNSLSPGPAGSETSRYKRFLQGAASPSRSDNSPTPTTDGSMSLMRLALTPESIRPLLGHAQNVRVHLNECIGEVHHIIGGLSAI